MKHSVRMAIPLSTHAPWDRHTDKERCCTLMESCGSKAALTITTNRQEAEKIGLCR